MKKNLFVMSCIAVTLAVAPACATKKFVRTEVGQVNDKVTTVGKSLEETQERVRVAEGRITEVDSKAAQAGQAAQTAQQNAQAAQQTGTQAMEVGKTAAARAEAVEVASRKLIFETVLSDDKARFARGKDDLSDETKAAIDAIVSQLKSQKANIYVEIEGHTDNTGDAAFNQSLGLARAEAVKRYLYEQHQVPLHKINVISYGEEKPVAPNNTRDGRAQNRRVVIKVLA
jgi:outer membrane protein OmpA-like peptidoglycan-associated protein